MWKKHRISIILGVVSVVLLSSFYFLPQFAFVFFLSILLTLLLKPVVDFMAKKFHRTIAAAVTMVLFLFLFFTAMSLITHSFIPSVNQLTEAVPKLIYRLQHLSSELPSQYASYLTTILSEASSFGVNALQNSVVVLFTLFSRVIDFVIIIFITFYLLADGKKVQEYSASLFPKDGNRRVFNLISDILVSLEKYVRAQLLMCLITSIVVFSYFTLMDLPYAPVFAVLSGVGELVPVLGPTTASIVGTVITGATAPYTAIQTGVFYLILTQINHNLIYPAIIGRSLNLHPLATILAVVLGGELLGAAGMFLAVPCLVIIKHILEDIAGHQPVS